MTAVERDEEGTLSLRAGGVTTRIAISEDRVVTVHEGATQVDIDTVAVLAGLGAPPHWWPHLRVARRYVDLLPNVPVEQLRPLALGMVVERQGFVHSNPSLHAVFAQDPAPKVRDSVARATQDLAVLEGLCADSNSMVRMRAQTRRRALDPKARQEFDDLWGL